MATTCETDSQPNVNNLSRTPGRYKYDCVKTTRLCENICEQSPDDHCYEISWRLAQHRMKIRLGDGCRDNGYPKTIMHMCCGQMTGQKGKNYIPIIIYNVFDIQVPAWTRTVYSSALYGMTGDISWTQYQTETPFSQCPSLTRLSATKYERMQDYSYTAYSHMNYCNTALMHELRVLQPINAWIRMAELGLYIPCIQ